MVAMESAICIYPQRWKQLKQCSDQRAGQNLSDGLILWVLLNTIKGISPLPNASIDNTSQKQRSPISTELESLNFCKSWFRWVWNFEININCHENQNEDWRTESVKKCRWANVYFAVASLPQVPYIDSPDQDDSGVVFLQIVCCLPSADCFELL